MNQSIQCGLILDKQLEKSHKTKQAQLSFQFLTEARVQEAAELYTISFVKLNKMWKVLGADYDQVFSVNRARMISCCKAGWSCIMVDKSINKLLAVSPNMDLLDYIDAPTMPNNSLFLKTLGKYAIQLQKQFFQSLRPTLKRGDCVYTYGGAVNLSLAHSGVTKKFWSIGLVYVKYAGFKTLYGRVTNRITTKILTSFGAKVIKTVNITEPGVQGEFLELIRLNLSELSYQSLSKFYEDALQEQEEEQDKPTSARNESQSPPKNNKTGQ